MRLSALVSDCTFAERFTVHSEVAHGGMGRVYSATQHAGGQPVAIKVLDPGLAGDPVRFAAEAALLEQLDHPAIVSYVAHGLTTDGRAYLAMRWLDGENLQERLARGALAFADVVAIGERVADALGYLHARGIVHRDIKPSNVLLVDGDPAKAIVIDLGIAKQLGAGGPTRTGQVVGTPGYMAPEQVIGDAGVDCRVDLFALGCLLHQATSGEMPFPGVHVMEVLAHLLLREPTPLTALVPDCPPRLETLVAVLLAKRAEDRTVDAVQARAELAAIASALSASDRDALARSPFAGLLHAREPATTPNAMLRSAFAATTPSGEGFAIAITQASGDTAIDVVRLPRVGPGRFRRYWSWAIPTVAAGAALVTLIATRGAAEQACRVPADALPGIWDTSRKAQVEAAIAKSGLPSPAASVATIARVGDAYAEEWRAMRGSACEATQIRKEQPEAVMELRMACLDDRARALRAVVDQLATADRAVAARAVSTMASLPPIEGCGDVAALRSSIPLPSEPAKRQHADAIRAELATIHALREAGRYAAARTRIGPLRAQIAELDYAPVSAEVLELAARLAEDAAAFVEADQLYTEASLRADAGRHDMVRARVLIAHFELLGGHLQDRARTAALADQITAVVRRLDRPDELTAAFLLARGAVAYNRSELARAETDLQAGLAILTRIHGANDLRRAPPLRALAGVLLAGDGRAGEAARYFAEALALQRAVYGAEHPEVAMSIAAAAGTDYMTSRYDAALKTYGEALAMLERTVGPEDHRYAKVLDQTASTWEWNNDTKRAIELHRRAVELDRKVLPAGHPQTLTALRNLASALELDHRYADARALLEEVLGHLERNFPRAHRQRAETVHQLAILRLGERDHAGALDLAMQAYAIYREALGDLYRPYSELATAGAALMALGRPVDAAAKLEEAVGSLAKDDDPRQAAWIRSWLGRALVESRRDVARGKQLVVDAWPILARDEQTEEERASLRPWMTAHGLRAD